MSHEGPSTSVSPTPGTGPVEGPDPDQTRPQVTYGRTTGPLTLKTDRAEGYRGVDDGVRSSKVLQTHSVSVGVV